MDTLTLAFGIAGIVGAVLTGVFGAVPSILEWHYDRANRPLRVKVFPVRTQINPAFGGRIRFRVYNRVRSEVPVQISPLTACEAGVDENGKTWVRGRLFDEPRVSLYPSGKVGGFTSIPGHDSRDFVLDLPVRQGVLEGTEDVSPAVFANRFEAQEIRLVPFHFEVSPEFH